VSCSPVSACCSWPPPAAAGRRLEAQAAADLRQLAHEHSAMDETESPRAEFGSA